MFCECGGLLMNEDGQVVCEDCGKVSKAGISMSEKSQKTEKLLSHNKEVKHPVTNERCPKCGHSKAHFWIKQTRAADEAPTRFYKCTKCEHTWREYD